MLGADTAIRHLCALAARPRPAGGPAEAAARAYCSGILQTLGFTLEEHRFSYSAFPGRYGTVVAGLALIGAMSIAGLAGFHGDAGLALLVLGGVGVAAGVASLWMARRGVLVCGWMRERGINLVARRGSPRVWLVAHLDSKSQPIPILVRAAGISCGSLVFATALAMAVAQVLGANTTAWWPWLTVAGIVSGIPVAASLVGSRSPGAADNASGVATVLLAAELIAGEQPLGIVLTTAEELGLAGARAWSLASARGTAINIDTIDDRGVLTAMYTRGPPHALLAAMRTAAAGGGLRIRARRLIPGILVDGVALADAGWSVVTLSKGSAATLARVHTPRDTADRYSGVGIVEAARLVRDVVDGGR